MEEIRFENPKKGLIPSIISSILTTASIFCCIMFGVMVKDHFELQATAENFEGLGSIGIILVGIIFMLISLICMMISIVFSLFTVLKGNKTFRLIGIILLVTNFLVIICNTVIFIILKQG